MTLKSRLRVTLKSLEIGHHSIDHIRVPNYPLQFVSVMLRIVKLCIGLSR